MIPFTAPIGLALLLTASVLTLTSLVISRAHLIYQKRQEVIIKESDEKEIEDVQPDMISKVKQREIKANASPLPALADVVDHDDEEGESEHPRERGHMPF